MLVVSSRLWGTSYQLLCRLISMHSILKWAIWINIPCPALLIPCWNRSCQALLNTAFFWCSVANVSMFIMLKLLKPTPLPNWLCHGIFWKAFILPAYLWIIAVSYRLGSKHSDSLGSFVTQPLNCHSSACTVGLLGHLGGRLSWMGTYLFFSLGCLASCSSHLCLVFGLFILWAASEVCITALHTLLNILGLDPLLTSTELAIWICISLQISFYQTRLSA